MKLPPNTCPDIDLIINTISDVYNNLSNISDELTKDQIIDYVSDEIWNLRQYTLSRGNPLEDLRNANSQLRDWGHECEDRAIRLENELHELNN